MLLWEAGAARPGSHLHMIEVICNDRLGKKIRVKCNEDDTIGDLKKLVAAHAGAQSRLSCFQPQLTERVSRHAS